MSPSGQWRLKARRTVTPVVSGLRMYWRTALMVVMTGAVSLTVLVPLASGPRKVVESGDRTLLAGRDLGIQWGVFAESPMVTQHRATALLFQLLVGTAFAVLATAGLTILTLSAARGATRESEVAVRRAVGASRGGLLASALLEATLLSTVAMVIGIGSGFLGGRLARSGWPAMVSAGGMPIVLIGSLAVGGAIILGAIFPLVFARNRRVVVAEGRPLQLFVPALQLGISLTVLTASALVAHHASSLMDRGIGHGGDGQVFQIGAPLFSPAVRAHRYAELLGRLAENSPGQIVSLTSPGALVGLGMTDMATTDCGRCYQDGIYVGHHAVSTTHLFVSADSFRALGVRLIAGRGIADGDTWDSKRVAVVNTRLAEEHFQNGQPIGRDIRIGREADDWYTVVGIVEDPPRVGLGTALEPPYSVYLSILQDPAPRADLLIRSGSPAANSRVTGAIEGTIGTPSRDITVTSESGILAAEGAPLNWFGRWFGLEGWVALLIAALGTFAVMRLWVLSLLPELGVRRAVGARRRHLFAFILFRAMGVAIAGVAIGLWFGPALWESLTGIVAGLPQWDSSLLACYAGLLIITTVAGALVPAIRAAQAPPATLVESTGE
jgi:hypothetical protein